MVSDKSQVRATGRITALTRQPVKGRQRHGGIRLGEMERDALLSHGVAFCLQDRLMHCSDAHIAHVCGKCGGLLTVYQHAKTTANSTTTTNSNSSTTASAFEVAEVSFDGQGNSNFRASMKQTCRICKTSDYVRPILLPYVFRYLSNELAAMGIKMSLELQDI
jgi:DNA-directed RNA polymerase I subunit RPA2